MPLEHWMMFSTFAEQEHFVYPKLNTYNGVVINANMAAHAPSGIAQFLLGKLTDNHKYLVDPITHAFQHDPVFIRRDSGKGEIKRSIKKLADKYGEPISSVAGNNPLTPQHVTDVANLSQNVLEFQRSHLLNEMKDSDAAKYLDVSEIRPPYALIAPYFYMNDTEWEKWLQKNIDCLEASLKITHEKRELLFAEVVIDRGVLLDSKASAKIVEGYRGLSTAPNGCIIWIDNFDEQAASTAEIYAFKELCTSLKSIFSEVINLHGGYFSIMLGGSVGGECLTGVTHGPEFGEFRSVVPVGGGIPIARYYIPRLHSRVRYREAAVLFSNTGWLDSYKKFEENVCDCDECRDALKGDASRFTLFGEGEVKDILRKGGMVRIEFPTTATKIRCLRHYLQRKHREFQMVTEAHADVMLNEIAGSIRDYKPLAGNDAIAHLIRWQKVLSQK